MIQNHLTELPSRRQLGRYTSDGLDPRIEIRTSPPPVFRTRDG